MSSTSNPLWHGVVLVAGGAIGAGMFALPVVSAGAWFSWASLGLVVTWFFTYLAATTLLEINLQFEPGASFDTVVRGVLGSTLARVNNVAIAFIMYILMYAYITAGASILDHSLSSVFGVAKEVPRSALSATFALLVGMFVWLGTSAVSRVSTMLMVGLMVSFVLANTSLAIDLDWPTLLPHPEHRPYLVFLMAALPVYVTAFACAGLVPSLVKHYPLHPERSKQSLLLGTLLVLAIYLIWITMTFGALARSDYVSVIQGGGNIGDLVSALQARGATPALKPTLDWFSNFAIATSFLAVGLGLFHFISDRFHFNETAIGRAKSASLTFIPPAVASVFFPYGFIKAIGYAGLLVAFSFFVIPALMHVKRHGQKLVSLAVLVFGVAIAALKGCLVFGLLPTFGV